jgi:MSHA biogenesis protein MshN
MSVLNTMLRDLERRGAPPPRRPAAEAPPIASPVAAAPQPEPRSRRFVRPALLAAAAAAVVVVAGYGLWPRPAPQVHRAATVLPVPPPPAAVAPTAPAVLAAPPSVLPAPVLALPAAPPAGHAVPIVSAAPAAPAESQAPQPVRTHAPARTASPRGLVPTPVAEAPARPAPSAADAPAVTRSAARSDLARAMELIDHGRMGEAARLLAAAVSQRPDWSDARSALAAVQADSGDRRQALATLLDGVPIDPVRFGPTAAQLQAELNDPQGALSTLQRVPAERRDPAYHALAAAVAQRAGRHELAVAEYGTRLRSAPDDAAAWVGLAVSLQALGRNPQALEAYLGAARFPLGAELRRFVESRIREMRAAPALTPAPLPQAGEGS